MKLSVFYADGASIIADMAKLVFLCVGTTRIVGDSIGPRVGDYLRDAGVDAYVYGGSLKPVTALNVGLYKKMLAVRHAGDVVVVVDATLGDVNAVGTLRVSREGIRPGGAFDTRKERVGDMGVMAIVGESGGDMLTELKTRSEAFVDRLSRRAAELLAAAAENFNRKRALETQTAR